MTKMGRIKIFRNCHVQFKRKKTRIMVLVFSVFGLLYVFPTNGGTLFTFSRKLIVQGTTFETPSAQNIDKNVTVGPTIQIRGFTEMKFGPVQIFGVVGANTSNQLIWNVFKVYAHINISRYDNTTYSCCMKYKKNTVEITKTKTLSSFLYAHYRKRLGIFHFVCPNERYYLGEVPVGVAITVDGVSCAENEVVFLDPHYPLREPGRKLIIGTKIAYAGLSAEMIIEWMEAYQYLGVDKVVAYYVSDLNENALKVLQFYASSGFLDLYLFQTSWPDRYPRNYATKNRLSWNDEQIIVYDTFERYSGYMYFGIIDYDEFLIPSNNRTLKEMIEAIFSDHVYAAGLTFKSQYFFTSWGRQGSTTDTILGTCIYRPAFGPAFDRRKNIYKPGYIVPGMYSTHNVKPIAGFKMKRVPAEEGFLRHYRSCRSNVFDFTDFDCSNSSQKVNDASVAEWSLRIVDNVHRVRKLIFGTDSFIK